MFSSKKWFGAFVAASMLLALGSVGQVAAQTKLDASKLTEFGRTATPQEVKAWDIDVRPDFKGLPKGAGSVAMGERIWEDKCASCHGTFGESNSVFFQLVGYTTKKDIETGKVGSLQLGHDAPARTMTMKLDKLSTLWDYINRAMPWNAPKSLTADEVYAVVAYLMNLAAVVPNDFTLSDQNIAQVQSKLPNRLGMTTRHAMWPGKEINGVDGRKAKPDTQGSSCMKNCGGEPKISSMIPAYAMNAHGNLAEQNRLIGGVRGLDTRHPAPEPAASEAVIPAAATAATVTTAAAAAPAASSTAVSTGVASAAPKGLIKASDILPTLQKYNCTACHAVNHKVVGPGFKDVAKKYAGRADGGAYLMEKIKSGSQGAWGSIPMPPNQVAQPDLQRIVQWLTQGAQP